MTTLLKNARILTLENDDIKFGDILIENNIIKKIDQNIEGNFDKIIDCEKNLLMPGFKNAHAHTAMVFGRSFADDLPLQEWLFNKIFPLEEKFIEGDIYHLTKCGILEYLSGGITAAFDMYFANEEIKKASIEMGFRTVILFTSLNYSISYMENILLHDDDNELVTHCLGLHAEYTTEYNRIKDIAALANKIKTPVYLHISETEKEVQECINRYNRTPLKFLDDEGMFNYGGGGFHCIYFSEEDIEIAKKRKFNIVTCPASNLKLASGIAPIKKYFDNGLNISIGTDGASSNNSLDMFKEMYLVATLQKYLCKDASAMNALDVLKMATINSAIAMGLNKSTTLKEGNYADIIMIDLKNPAMQPLNDIAKNIVYSGSKDIVKMTMINGKILYYNHEFYLNEDIETIYRKTQEIVDRLKKE